MTQAEAAKIDKLAAELGLKYKGDVNRMSGTFMNDKGDTWTFSASVLAMTSYDAFASLMIEFAGKRELGKWEVSDGLESNSV